MKPEELRIGNLVEWVFPNRNNQPNKYEYLKVQSIDKKLIGIRNSAYGYDQIRPIPITEDWLLKFGFNKHKHYENLFFIFNSKFRYDTKNMMFEIMIPCSMGGESKKNTCGDGVKISIKYICQLQNLYFALTGQELTIKN